MDISKHEVLMKGTKTKIVIAILAILVVSIAVNAAPRSKPNVILIMGDDLGYECLSCNGSTSYRTPNLDKLAQTGARFTHCYVNPLCTPTRTPLMTGRYTFRHYTTFGCLPQGEKTFGHMMRNAGYATCIVGKWQLAHGSPPGQSPEEAGFEEYFMKVDNDSKGYADPVIYSRHLEPMKIPGSYGPDLFYEYIAGFLERHQDKPFYPNGVKGHASSRQIKNCTYRLGERAIGTRGVANPYSGIQGERSYDYPGPFDNPRNIQWGKFVESIRHGHPLNKGTQIAEATMTAILGRMAAYTGRAINYSWALNQSKLDLVPETLEFGPHPVEAQATPGITPLV